MPLGQVKFSELGAEEPAAGEESLAGVKALTAKLKLQTRRPSYLEWEARVRGQPWGRPTPRGAKGTSGHPRAEQDGSVCGFPGMEEALEWLRTELQELQAADQRLAQQLMRLRAQLNRLKVEQVCHRHKEMLDDATFGLESCEEDSDLLCTIPPKAAFLLSMPLKHIGVTRMNINSRRFSLC
ncbi:protein FAM167B isoform X1 [Gallus gallus]|uniref:protein FAM167B isoform X1 n=1 Tax=Gallus gallus TaxID=9031 RepID=UPI00003AC608|nr:protein FAM167B isoform X1 [Gallus gallus]XP_040545787.1 protein FAM167B isoform X1 [Gallus gallus]|eukprot:XP_001234111.1 protein FAM167B [Gallus gallus]